MDDDYNCFSFDIFKLFSDFFETISNRSTDATFIIEIIKSANLDIRDIIKMIENLIQINRICMINENESNTAFVHFEIVVYLIKIMINKYEEELRGTYRVHTTKEYIRKIIQNGNNNTETFYYNKEYVYTCQRILNNLDESDSNNGYVCILYNHQEDNLLDCKVLLDNVYGIKKYFFTPRINKAKIEKAKEILKYINLFYSDV